MNARTDTCTLYKQGTSGVCLPPFDSRGLGEDGLRPPTFLRSTDLGRVAWVHTDRRTQCSRTCLGKL
eukprot:165668-Amphidinium_carterae.1